MSSRIKVLSVNTVKTYLQQIRKFMEIMTTPTIFGFEIKHDFIVMSSVKKNRDGLTVTVSLLGLRLNLKTQFVVKVLKIQK